MAYDVVTGQEGIKFLIGTANSVSFTEIQS